MKLYYEVYIETNTTHEEQWGTMDAEVLRTIRERFPQARVWADGEELTETSVWGCAR